MSIMPEGGWSDPAQKEPRVLRATQASDLSNLQSSERWIVGLFLIVVLLTFFFPLVTVELPILGAQEMSGYDLVTKGKEFDRALSTIKSGGTDQESPAPSPLSSPDSDAAFLHSSMPFSLQIIWLIPIELILSFGCAILALLCCLGPFGLRPTKVFSSIGATASIATVLHIVIANSDVHTWLRNQMTANSSVVSNDPFAGLAQQIQTLALNSVQLKPGSGLYVQVAALSLAAIVLLSRILFTSHLVEVAVQPYDVAPNSRYRRILGIVLLTLATVAVSVVVAHFAEAPPARLDAFSGEFSASKALMFLFKNYDQTSNSSTAVVSNEAGQNSRSRSELILDSLLTRAGKQKHLIVVSTAASGDDCHACQPGIGAYLFAKTETGWVLEISDKEIDRFGAFGAPGKAKSIDFAPSVRGFSLTLEDGHQGETDIAELFVAPVDNHFRSVLSLSIESDNLGNCGSQDPEMILGHDPCVQTKSSVRFLKSFHHGLSDIEVAESGTKNTDTGVVPTNDKRIFIFSGDKYSLQN